jgi:hypothetical protein
MEIMTGQADESGKHRCVVFSHGFGVWKDVEGMTVMLMHPRVLREYKEHLFGEHQEQDRRFLDGYIVSNGL